MGSGEWGRNQFKIQNSKLKKKTGVDVALVFRRVGDEGENENNQCPITNN
ncbi:hypothetical protein [Nostoc sp.]